jgi:hypothetical protein
MYRANLGERREEGRYAEWRDIEGDWESWVWEGLGGGLKLEGRGIDGGRVELFFD